MKVRHMTRSTNERQLLDPINCRLLKELQSDARLSLAELARRTNLSAPAVGERHDEGNMAVIER